MALLAALLLLGVLCPGSSIVATARLEAAGRRAMAPLPINRVGSRAGAARLGRPMLPLRAPNGAAVSANQATAGIEAEIRNCQLEGWRRCAD